MYDYLTKEQKASFADVALFYSPLTIGDIENWAESQTLELRPSQVDDMLYITKATLEEWSVYA